MYRIRKACGFMKFYIELYTDIVYTTPLVDKQIHAGIEHTCLASNLGGNESRGRDWLRGIGD